MSDATTRESVRSRVESILRAMSVEDLEERVAPVKCSKHPDHEECMGDYGVILYAVPEPETPEE